MQLTKNTGASSVEFWCLGYGLGYGIWRAARGVDILRKLRRTISIRIGTKLVFKGASQNSQRRAGRESKGDHASKLRKLDIIEAAKPSKAVLNKLKNLAQGQVAREAKQKLKAETQREALDPKSAEKRRKKIAKKLTKRMSNVVVEVRKRPR